MSHRKTSMSEYSEDGNTEFYTVEEIIDMKEVNGKEFYYIKWEGYSNKDNTWEPVENLTTCPDMLKEFRQERKKKEESKKLQKLVQKEKLKRASEDSIDHNKKKEKKKKLVREEETKDSSESSIIELGKRHKSEKKSPKPEHETLKYLKELKPKKKKKSSTKLEPGNINSDIPVAITGVRKARDDSIEYILEWAKRKDKIEPLKSSWPSEEVRKKYSEMIIDFLEKHITLRPKKK